MIADRRKFTTKITVYGMISIFIIGINSKSFPWRVHFVQKHPQILCDVQRPFTSDTTRHAML